MTSPSGQPRPVRAPAGSRAFHDIVNAAVPPRPGHDHSRPMCAAWDDHRTRRRTFTVSSAFIAPLDADRVPLPPEEHGWFSLGWTEP